MYSVILAACFLLRILRSSKDYAQKFLYIFRLFLTEFKIPLVIHGFVKIFFCLLVKRLIAAHYRLWYHEQKN